MSSPLSNAQKRYLRGLAHDLKPVVMVGAKGIGPSLLAELDQALEMHELLKVKVSAEDREQRDALIESLIEPSGAALVARIGHVAVLYRRRSENPLVILPGLEATVQLFQEAPDTRYQLRSADGELARVNERELRRSFVVSPEQLLDDWRPRDIDELQPSDMDALLALQPAVVLLGSGARQRFPAPAVLAACLGRGIGIEVMDNAAAARTFNLLAGEGRRVVAGFLL